MDEINELIMLYDYYGELLSDSQKEYFMDYYFNNLSLGEIADNLEISRNAVHKQIKSAEAKLKEYEEKLKIIKKSNLIMVPRLILGRPHGQFYFVIFSARSERSAHV